MAQIDNMAEIEDGLFDFLYEQQQFNDVINASSKPESIPQLSPSTIPSNRDSTFDEIKQANEPQIEYYDKKKQIENLDPVDFHFYLHRLATDNPYLYSFWYFQILLDISKPEKSESFYDNKAKLLLAMHNGKHANPSNYAKNRSTIILHCNYVGLLTDKQLKNAFWGCSNNDITKAKKLYSEIQSVYHIHGAFFLTEAIIVGFPFALLTFGAFYGLLLYSSGLLGTSVIFPALVSTLFTIWPVAAVLLAGCVLLQLGFFLYTRNTTESNCKQIDKQLRKEPQSNTVPSDTFITHIYPSAPPLNGQHQKDFPIPSAPPLDEQHQEGYPTPSAPPLGNHDKR